MCFSRLKSKTGHSTQHGKVGVIRPCLPERRYRERSRANIAYGSNPCCVA